MPTVLWLQTGACSGDIMSVLCADRPSLESLVDFYNIEILWQPSLSHQPVSHLAETIDHILNDELCLDRVVPAMSIMSTISKIIRRAVAPVCFLISAVAGH